METRRDINFDKYKYMSFKLEKLEDTEFDDDHPNAIDVGFVINEAFIDLKLSNKLCALVVYEMPDRLFHTSEIRKQKECKGYDLLYTLNSIYKVTPNFTAIPGVQEKYFVTLKTLETNGKKIN